MINKLRISMPSQENQGWLRNSDEATRRVHANSEKPHFPYPVSLLSFQRNETLVPITSALRKWAQDNGGYGDGTPTLVIDNIQYRYVECEDVYQSWFGYAPKNPLIEFPNALPEVTISHGEIDIIMGPNGIEIASLSQVPFVMYNLL